mgnify:FL=1|jgi:hypothetical protein
MTSDNAVNDLKIRLTNLIAEVYRFRAAKSSTETIEGFDKIVMLWKHHNSLENQDSAIREAVENPVGLDKNIV